MYYIGSLFPRLSPRTTPMKTEEGRAWYPFAHDATEQTSRIYQQVGLDITHMQTAHSVTLYFRELQGLASRTKKKDQAMQ